MRKNGNFACRKDNCHTRKYIEKSTNYDIGVVYRIGNVVIYTRGVCLTKNF